MAHRFSFETEEGTAGGGENDGGSVVGGATMDVADGSGVRAAAPRKEMMLAVTRTKGVAVVRLLSRWRCKEGRQGTTEV